MKMSQDVLNNILADHKKWLENNDYGCRADLSGANLSHVKLTDAKLSGSNLIGANLSGALLIGIKLNDANLIGADLSGANLDNANLRGAGLNDANLCSANLRHAKLNDAKLSGANLSDSKLSYANLSGAHLNDVNLSYATLHKAVLSGANLSSANLVGAKLDGANLSDVNLSHAILIDAKLSGANLSDSNLNNAKLSGAKLSSANLSGTNLSSALLNGAHLSDANLYGANLSDANLRGAILNQACIYKTIFGYTDLTGAVIDKCKHMGSSIFDFSTLQISGMLPLAFLRGCGLPDHYIDYLPSLLNKPIQFYDCFISYSSEAHEFAEKLHSDLQGKGVRCWFAPHDLKIGDPIKSTIETQIRIKDKLLVIFSENSIDSDWVEHEVDTALAEENKRKELILLPIRIDDFVMEAKFGWARKIRQADKPTGRHIGDFTQWKEHDEYTIALERLLRDLKPSAK